MINDHLNLAVLKFIWIGLFETKKPTDKQKI